MLTRLISLLNDHQFEEYLSNSDNVTEDKLRKVESFQGEIIESDILITLLWCVNGRDGGDITGNFNTEEGFNDFIDLLNSMGLNCFVDLSPKLTEAENMKSLMTDKELDKLEER